MNGEKKFGFKSLNTIELASYLYKLCVPTVVKQDTGTVVKYSTTSKAEHAFERALQKQGKAKYVDFLQTELACFVFSEPSEVFSMI